MRYSAVLAALVAAAAAKDGRTFAVLRFQGDGPLTEGRSDPIVSPGQVSGHVHTVQGGSNFGNSATGEDMMKSECSTAMIAGDNSAYWMPKLYFHDVKNNSFEPVPLFYMNVYYFFEGTNDKIEAFPPGLQMVSGDAMTRTAPASGDLNLDPSKGTIQPAQLVCPHQDRSLHAWPAGSDGSKAGIQDSNNDGAGVGFPFIECDGYASPLRADLHFPSCYDPSKALNDYKNNMVWPTSKNGKQDCPAGFKHVPHLFYEMYWNTPLFKDRWAHDGTSQPFVWANGDVSGYSLHGDFLAGWETDVLQAIIDTCDAGSSGMDKCPKLLKGLNDKSKKCKIANPSPEQIDGVLAKLPGNNPLSGLQYGTSVGSMPPASGGSSGSSPAQPPASSNAGTAASSKAATPATSNAASPPVQAPSSSKNSGSQSSSAKSPAVSAAISAAPNNEAAPTITSAKVVTTTDAAGQRKVTTIWETVTVWATATVYDDGTPVPTAASSAASTVADVAGWKYAGCYKDTRDRVLRGARLPNLGPMTNDKCVKYCQSKGFAISGTEYGGQCFCGNQLEGSQKIDASACKMTCAGDAKDTCGGSLSLTVFSKDGTVSETTAAQKQARHLHDHVLHHRKQPFSMRLRK